MSERRQDLCWAADLRGARSTALARVPGRTVKFGDVPPQGKLVEQAAGQCLTCVQSSDSGVFRAPGPLLAPPSQFLVAQDSQGPWRKLGLPSPSVVSLPLVPNLTTSLCQSCCPVFGSCHLLPGSLRWSHYPSPCPASLSSKNVLQVAARVAHLSLRVSSPSQL